MFFYFVLFLFWVSNYFGGNQLEEFIIISCVFFHFPLYFHLKTCLLHSYAFIWTLRTMSTLSWGECRMFWLLMYFVLFLVEKFRNHLFYFVKKKKKTCLQWCLWFVHMHHCVIFENFVELWTLVWKSLVSLSIWTHDYLIRIFEHDHLLLVFE